MARPWTEGPWMSGGCVVWQTDNDMVADLSMACLSRGGDETEANARLISQAPAMYELLEALSDSDLGGYNAEVTALLTLANPEREG